MDHIFLLGVIYEGEEGKRRARGKRVWGWFKTFESAESEITQHDSHYFEDGYYNIGIIEKHEEGMSVSEEAFWYRYDRDTKKTVRIEPPDFANRVCNFLMG